jgi:hypothetical protein
VIDVEDLVHRAASATGPHVADLDRIRRRAARRRRRRAAFAAGGAALAVMSVLVTPIYLTRSAPSPSPGAPSAAITTTTAPAPAQRLVLPGEGWTESVEGRPTAGVTGVDGIAEVRADGGLDVLPRPPGFDHINELEALADGRLVALGSRDLMPGVERDDGPMVEGVEFPLVVTRPGGAVVSSRDVRVRGEHVALLGVSDGVAYLARPTGVVAHDLDTGAERLVVPLTLDVSYGDQAGSTAVLVSQGTLVVVDLASGRETGRFPLPGYRGQMRLSPDGRLLAVVTLAGNDETVEIRDVATGRVTIAQPIRRDVRHFDSRSTGLAWTDATTVRAAWPELPAGADRIYPFADALRTMLISVR